MEFSIDIHTEINGNILIEDLSKEYYQYIKEDIDVVTTFDLFKFSESVTINTILKMGISEATLIDVLLNKHQEETDSCKFKVKDDGYYVIDHFVLPNEKWYKTASKEYKDYYTTIYIVGDDEKIYKEVEGKLEECSIKEILERNIEGTTIKKCKIEIFFTGNLQQCYINYCKQLFNSLLNKCLDNSQSKNIFTRDFIWMTLNIIDYLVGFKQFMEAERILSVFRQCGGFCKLHDDNKHISCGCS